ncbi:MAG: CYTH domain-containing protein [Syntrophaceae bacterium]
MAKEIERKFLVTGDAWRTGISGMLYRQGYIPAQGCSVRVRTTEETGYLTIKARDQGITRTEFEYAIPLTDASEMLSRFCTGTLIEKIRYRVEYAGLVWEIDEFTGANAGLIVAEVELEHEDQALEKPEWVGAEVTHDRRYLNSTLARQPYSLWKEP